MPHQLGSKRTILFFTFFHVNVRESFFNTSDYKYRIQERWQMAVVNDDFGHFPSKDEENVSMCQQAKNIMVPVAGVMDA
jgi:hypothetical protein